MLREDPPLQSLWQEGEYWNTQVAHSHKPAGHQTADDLKKLLKEKSAKGSPKPPWGIEGVRSAVLSIKNSRYWHIEYIMIANNAIKANEGARFKLVATEIVGYVKSLVF